MTTRVRHLAFAALAAMLLSAPAGAATITIVNADGAGEGFNDPTPAAPVGGNPGTTIGAQRLFVFQHAAALWGAILPSPVTIRVSARFDPQFCDASSAVLGSAGPISVVANFAGAIETNTWYHIALANKLSGTDLSPSGDDISATFNSSLDGGTCLGGATWYYGIDGNEGVEVELLPVVLHELGHGLGFSTLVNSSTGGQLQNRADIYERFLFDNQTGLHWDEMGNPQRAASATNTGHLTWDGPAVTGAAPSVLGPKGRVTVNAPGGIAGDLAFGTADFGAPLSSPGVTGNVVLVNDGVGTATDACEPIANAGAVSGNIALLDRGNCTFVEKAAAAQAAGAIAVIVVNNAAGDPPGMGGVAPGVTIPVVSITLADGNTIKSNLPGVNVTLGLDPVLLAGADASNRLLMYAPNPLESGSSVSHWDDSATPNLLMEPFINLDLSSDVDLTRQLFEDIGWSPVLNSAPNPVARRLDVRSAPNPFASRTTLAFELDRAAPVALDIFDLGGRRVRQLVRGVQPAGGHSVTWDGRDGGGVRLPNGVYLARIDADGVRGVQRIVKLD